MIYFKRKAYNELLKWKREYSGKYAALLEGPRRVGKSTIAEQFAINEYKSHVTTLPPKGRELPESYSQELFLLLRRWAS